jgi:acetate kinase
VVDALRYLHLALDDASNEEGLADRDHAATGSPVRIMVIKAREDLSILREVLTVAAQS